jgi:23S rRNA pseudouridine2605 synthase
MVQHSSHPNRPSPAGQADADDDAARDASDDGPDDGQPGERVAKVLARAGVASRREVERFIEAGRVRLNGEVLTTPAVKIAPGDIVQVDGKVVDEPEPARVWRYHKPVGLLTSHFDPKGRPTVFDALPKDLPRVISVGRLDLNSEGLLLLTNDGGLARALELPAAGLPRRYRARARGRVTQERLDKLKDGVTVEGVHYGAIEARLDKAKEEATGANLWITLTLTEGKNREVRKVLEALGLTVNRLIRLAYGPFQLGTLAAGEVEEVGPRVIREQLADHIAPENLPSGTRTPAPASSAPKPKSKAFKDTAEADKPKVYKEGWARPVHKPNPHRTGAKRFRPKAEPTVISARPLPAKRDGAPAARGPAPRGDDRKSGGKPGGKPFKSDRKPSSADAPGRKWFDAPKPRDGEPAKPRGQDKPAKPSGFSGQPYAGSSPRAAAKPGGKPYGAPGAGGKPGGAPRAEGKPFAGKPGGKPTGRR